MSATYSPFESSLAKVLALLLASGLWSCDSKQQTPQQSPKKTTTTSDCDNSGLRLQSEDDETGDNETGDDSDSDTEPAVTYQDDIKELLEDHCVSCHGSKGGKQAPLLDTWTKVKSARTKIASEIASGDMPTEDEDPLTKKQKDLVAAWKKGGYLEKKSSSSDDEEDDEDSGNEDDDRTSSSRDCP